MSLKESPLSLDLSTPASPLARAQRQGLFH